MAKPAVIVVGADKGGVGKTTVSRTLLDYFNANSVPTRAFDTESPRGTLKRFHPDITEIVDITSVADQMRIFDTLSSTDANVTVIDVRALMGYVQIRFPTGVRVECEGHAIAGFFALKGGAAAAGAPCVVRVTGRATMGFAECFVPGGG